MVMWHERLSDLAEDSERRGVPMDWRAWESMQLSWRRRQIEHHRRAYHREVLALCTFTLAALVIICWAWQVSL